ncbi:MAG: hypothetical protein KAQ92_00595, partial [Candidatus Aenigmarchaeota archaeon]|nr:hypothetical protein [Candidatus Aenigmarchaeota archaeon]
MNKEIVEIEKLKETVKILKREREKLNNKTNEFILKNKKELNGVFDTKISIRDILNQNKKYVIEIKKLKEERNALNQRVSDINNDISEMRKKIDGKNHAKKNNADYDQNTIVDLKQKITKLEWQIQTKPVSIRKEDQMQEQLSKMTNFLRKIKENARYNRKIKRVKSKRNELKEQADEKH